MKLHYGWQDISELLTKYFRDLTWLLSDIERNAHEMIIKGLVLQPKLTSFTVTVASDSLAQGFFNIRLGTCSGN